VLNDKRTFTATVVGTDPSTDIALLKIEAKDLPTVVFGNSDDLKVGYLDQKLRFSKTNAITSILDRQIQWTADGKGLYYPDDTGRLQYLQDVSDPDAKPMEVESDHFAKSFIVTPDQSTIYFIDKEGTLWMKKGETDAVAAAEKVIDNSLTLASDGQGLYFIADSAHDKKTGIDSGTLSYLSGSPDDKVSKIADKVAYVSVRKAGVAYYVFSKKSQDKNKFQVFYSDDGKNFSRVMENAYFW
jgi:hypothetical protein